ncbi:MAG: AraC family transcriptional regulator [Oscillospiraceae bacterium]|jgi:AraC family transcriptional regulator|nr:AraC family transcriptional regulator [Oscillospiraceae bacterium]
MFTKPQTYPAVKQALEYIERNIAQDVSVSALAREAGCSKYHFLRLFKAATGLTPGAYIRKRRLSEIARAIGGGDRPASDVAFYFGFNSKENFTRAFKSEHRVTLSEHIASGNSLDLLLDAPTPEVPADPEFAVLPELSLVVYACDEERPPQFWNKYNCRKLSQRLSGGAVVEDFGVGRFNEFTGRLDYWIGIREAEANGNTDNTVNLTVPGGSYAIFTTTPATQDDFVHVIHRTWAYINNIWLTRSGFRHTGGYEMESYIEDSRTYSERIYIPITG